LKPLFKTVVLSCAVWAAGAVLHAPSAHAYAAQFGVKIQINDSLVSFPDASPFIDGNGDLQVPLRPVAEQMGYRIDWSMDGADVRLTLQNNDRVMKLKSGSAAAEVNGKQVTMPSPALLKDGHVFVPVRFISESFGYMVQWDNRNGIAIICKDGKYHAPAWWAPAPAAPQTPSITAKLVETAKKYVGTPYVWGGTTPSGFDCSGFIRYVFGQQGVELPRTSREMFDHSGKPVSASDLRPGDLVFFSIGKKTTHVGIYLGNDSFISATSSRGIHIDSLASSYWGSKYIGAKRVV
jgi:peptidoglycan endopeptidase LytE